MNLLQSYHADIDLTDRYNNGTEYVYFGQHVTKYRQEGICSPFGEILESEIIRLTPCRCGD